METSPKFLLILRQQLFFSVCMRFLSYAFVFVVFTKFGCKPNPTLNDFHFIFFPQTFSFHFFLSILSLTLFRPIRVSLRCM